MEGEGITDAQRKLLFSRMQGNVSKEELETQLGCGISQLSKKEASILIDAFMKNGDPDLSGVVKKIREIRKGQTEQGHELTSAKDEKKDNDQSQYPDRTPEIPEPVELGNIRIGDIYISESSLESLKKIPAMLNSIFKNIMQKGTDYDLIPGTSKPTLLKSGAELLRMAFNLRVSTEVTVEREDWDKNFFYYVVTTKFFNANGDLIGTGKGSCNNAETRYASRWVFESDIPTDVDRTSCRTKTRTSKFGKEYTVYLVEPSMPEKASQANTVLKMAKKRSFVDGILSITGASRIFTQDMEDGGEQ
jgi:hypothetical protein